VYQYLVLLYVPGIADLAEDPTLLILLPTFEAALAGEISYGTNMSVPRVTLPGLPVYLVLPGI
jgi:hypothetical protein